MRPREYNEEDKIRLAELVYAVVFFCIVGEWNVIRPIVSTVLYCIVTANSLGYCTIRARIVECL